ncbi:peptidase [Candidatus Woesearchaeota archaeon]|nr:peptidase [Candidatus Woesearchaeota archaeon]
MERLQPTRLTAPAGTERLDRELLRHLTAASDIMGQLFLRQAYSKNEAVLASLKEKGDHASLERFRTHYGPFDRTEHDKPFITGHEKPKGAAFYPDDLTKQEWDCWLRRHPEDRESFTNHYTIIRRKEDRLIAIPYHDHYADLLAKAAEHLQQAAKHADNESLRRFLELRAQALLTDDYYESDVAWLDLDSSLEVTIGPYEVYEDRLNGIKAAYESFIGLVDEEATAELRHLEEHVQLLEERLPLPDEHRANRSGRRAPIRIVNLLHSAGDGRAGIHFTAFNLPNDERVRQEKGSKKVLLKNVAEAKFATCWQPITQRLLDDETRKHCSFGAYFLHILLHEISHGIGPGIIKKDGRETTVNKELKESYPFIEEAKADLLGVHNASVLAESGVLEKRMAEEVLVTYVAGIFRSIRFGLGEAHAGANMLAYNWLEEQGAARLEGRRLVIDRDQAKESLLLLVKRLLLIEDEGDRAGAEALLKKYNIMPGHVKEVLDGMSDIPIDIKPITPLGK